MPHTLPSGDSLRKSVTLVVALPLDGHNVEANHLCVAMAEVPPVVGQGLALHWVCGSKGT